MLRGFYVLSAPKSRFVEQKPRRPSPSKNAIRLAYPSSQDLDIRCQSCGQLISKTALTWPRLIRIQLIEGLVGARLSPRMEAAPTEISKKISDFGDFREEFSPLTSFFPLCDYQTSVGKGRERWSSEAGCCSQWASKKERSHCRLLCRRLPRVLDVKTDMTVHLKVSLSAPPTQLTLAFSLSAMFWGSSPTRDISRRVPDPDSPHKFGSR